MSVVRDLGFTVPAMVETILITCADALSTAGSTSAVPNKARTTADVLASPTAGTFTTGFGRVIDRLGAPFGAGYVVAMPSASLTATRGSTEANRQMQIGLYLLHGDSSGGGDLAEYSTASRPDDRTYFGTARTSEMLNWDGSISTGPLYAPTNPAYYDLRAAKRYLQLAVRVLKNKVTTESSGDEHARVDGFITFLGGDMLPQNADVITSPFSTTTST